MSGHHPVEPPAVGDALKRLFAYAFERESTACDEALHGLRHEDLVGFFTSSVSFALDARCKLLPRLLPNPRSRKRSHLLHALERKMSSSRLAIWGLAPSSSCLK